ncbi:glycosyltransferase [uncultured Brachyspira sp.]|uniref:glycosyltransferase n=1 Tax=uncultured Brachyspira sp. TaxID=221953 RepID=UPI002625DC7D|nr:glycosyltransferase [uncultured Brachyspira sp.]
MDKHSPTLSIIVPVYNVENYLSACIESILSQTFTDFELILVDDGSPDRSGAICDDYARRDSRIRVVHQTNQGLSEARNAGLDIMGGVRFIYRFR